MMSRRAGLRETTVETFRDVALHLEMYRFDEALKRFRSDVEHHPHKKSTTGDNDENETTFCNYGDDYDVSLVVDTTHLCAQKTICLRTFKVDDAQQCEEPFEAWMKAVEKIAVS